jgi:hypothetical protein
VIDDDASHRSRRHLNTQGTLVMTPRLSIQSSVSGTFAAMLLGEVVFHVLHTGSSSCALVWYLLQYSVWTCIAAAAAELLLCCSMMVLERHMAVVAQVLPPNQRRFSVLI